MTRSSPCLSCLISPAFLPHQVLLPFSRIPSPFTHTYNLTLLSRLPNLPHNSLVRPSILFHHPCDLVLSLLPHLSPLWSCRRQLSFICSLASSLHFPILSAGTRLRVATSTNTRRYKGSPRLSLLRQLGVGMTDRAAAPSPVWGTLHQQHPSRLSSSFPLSETPPESPIPRHAPV